MEQQPPPAAKLEEEEGYSYVTGTKCRLKIHTRTDFLLATVLLAWSFRKPGAFKAWLVRTTEHFLGLDMWKTRHFSQKQHGTQWATRLLSAAFAALTVVTGVTICILNGHYAGAATVSVSATACVSWHVHAARMRQLGFIDKADDKTWTEKGVVLQKLDFLWEVVVNGFESNVAQPFTNATLIIYAYNIVLGTTSLYLVLRSSGAVIVWANCLWGFLSLWLLQAGLLAGAFAAICKVAFNDDFDSLMNDAVEGYEEVSVVDEAIRIGTRHVDDAEREGDVIPLLIDVLRDDVNAVLRAKSLPLVPASLVTASAIMGRLNLTRRGAFTSYEAARLRVVHYLTGIEDGRIVFRDPPTGKLADIAACYDRELADDAKETELGGIAHQFAAKVTFLARYLGKRVGNQGGSTRQGGIKDEETVELAIRAGAYSAEGWKKGESVCSNEQCPSGIFRIRIGRDAELLTNRYVKERPAMRSQLAGAAAYIRSRMWWKFGEEPMDEEELDALDINTVGVQGYIAEFFRVPKSWEVHAKKNSQGLLMGFGTQIWYKCPGDKTWTLMDRGDDSKYWEHFATPTDADLDAAPCYDDLTINGARGGLKFAPIWRRRLALDNKYADKTWTESRDAARARHVAAAHGRVAAWNLERNGPPPVFSIALDDGSSERRCARVAFFSELAANPNKRTEDTYEYEPMANAVAEAGGICVSVKDHGLGAPDLVLVGCGVNLTMRGTHCTTLKIDARIVHVNWQLPEWGAESHPSTIGSLFGRRRAAASGSLAGRRARRGAAPTAATPAAPTESAAELAAAPCFVLDALKAGQPVLDDAAKRFRDHYACFERNRTDPADMRLIRVENVRTGKTAHQYFGEFYPTGGFGRQVPGFSPKDPPTASYP